MIVHYLGWSFKVQVFSWSRVKPPQCPLHLYLLNLLEVRVLWKVLKYKTNKQGVERVIFSEFQSLILKRWRGGRVTD